MSRLGGWLRAAVKDEDPVAASAREREALLEALEHTRLIMNDDIDRAHDLLKGGNSSFHRMGCTVTFFLRSVLGMEKAIMAQTSEMLGDCENRCWEDLKAAQKRGREGSVYPPGAEYELVRAETQLMGAVVGVLHESVVEAMKSFLKLRKAYITLDAIIANEAKAKAHGMTAVTEATEKLRIGMGAAAGSGTETPATAESSAVDTPRTEDSESEVFVDAKQALSGPQTPIEPPTSSSDPSIGEELVTVASPGLALEPGEPVFEDPVDIFIYSGSNMCYGILTLMLTLVPPSFARILSVVGFTGDRLKGVKMLWKSAKYDNINGAFAGMILLAFYNGLLGTVDILPHQNDFDDAAETVGPPREKCAKLLATMRQRYPASRLWRVEEARQYTRERNVTKAIEVLTTGELSRMKQVTALNDFELALDAMIDHKWGLMRDAFLRCLENNEWSPAMYYFLAGCASLELYRDAFHAGDKDEARREKQKAEDFLRKAPTVTGGKRLMAKKLPMEAFLQMRVQRWEERAATMGVDLADAPGVSPALEMAYMWNGTRRMGPKQLAMAEESLSFKRCTSEAVAEKIQQGGPEADELGVWALSLAAVRRTQGKREEARELLNEYIMKHDKNIFKGPTKNDYLPPSAVYELGVIAWDDCCDPPKVGESNGDGKVLEEADVAAYRREKFDECEAQMEKVKAWEVFVLDSRIGMRVQSGLETLRWFRNKMGWAV